MHDGRGDQKHAKFARNSELCTCWGPLIMGYSLFIQLSAEVKSLGRVHVRGLYTDLAV